MLEYERNQKSPRIIRFGDTIEEGTYQLLSRHSAYVNLTDRQRLITCTDKPDGAGPVNIILQGFDLEEIQFLKIGNREMEINGHCRLPLSDGVIFNSELDFPPLRGEDWQQAEDNISLCRHTLLMLAPDQSLAFVFDKQRVYHFSSAFQQLLFQQVVSAVDGMATGNLIDSLVSLKGVGWGLTPSGDDFIAGILTGLYLLQQIHGIDLSALRAKIYRKVKGCNLISNSFLYLASLGRFSEKFKVFLRALLGDNRARLIESLKIVMAMGSTSGSDLLSGLLFSLKSLEKQLIEEVGHDYARIG